MKKLTFILLAAVFVLASSCKKEGQRTTVREDFFLTATKNNTDWNTQGYSFAELSAKNYTVLGHNGEEHLLIHITTNNLNQYVLVANTTEFYITLGRDVAVARYALDESATNTVGISSYDMQKVILTGTFNLTFKKVSGGDTYPAAVTFTGGRFKVTKAYD